MRPSQILGALLLCASATALPAADAITKSYPITVTATGTQPFNPSATYSTPLYYSSTFVAMAIASGTKIHLRTISASATGFWIGNATRSSCHVSAPASCPVGNTTVFDFNYDVGDDGLIASGVSMAVEVPAGEPAYIGPWGALRFLPAHEGLIYPAGAIRTGWSQTENPGSTPLLHAPMGANWQACPVDGVPDVWSVFTNLGKFNLKGCIEFGMGMMDAQSPGAFQYD